MLRQEQTEGQYTLFGKLLVMKTFDSCNRNPKLVDYLLRNVHMYVMFI